MSLPIYGETDRFNQDTLTIDSLIQLVDLARIHNLRVGFRPLIGNSSDWSGVEHFGYAPTDKNVYFSYHLQIKRILAMVCEMLGVDVFNIDTENIVTTTSSEAIQVVEAVREVFTGIVGDTPVLNQNALQRGVLYPYLDYIHFSHASRFDPAYSLTELEAVFRYHIEQEVIPTVRATLKPCLIETFARFEPEHPQFQSNAYEAILRFLADEPYLTIGVSFWDDHLKSPSTAPAIGAVFSPIGRPAEAVLEEYFGTIIPETREYEFNPPGRVFTEAESLEDFERGVIPASFFITANGGTASMALEDSLSFSGGQSLRITFTNESDDGAFAYFFFGQTLARLANWTEFDALSLAIQGDGALESIIINIFDDDGDRFIVEHGIIQGVTGQWQKIVAPFEYFVQPQWAERGNGRLDLDNITSWSVLGRYFNGPSENFTWIDRVELLSESD